MTIGLLAAFLAPAGARADLVYFAKGGEAQVPATVEGSTVRLDAPGGPVSFPLEEFRAIVAGPTPEADWPGRRDRAGREGTPRARFEAAWWALENGLTDEATAFLVEARAGAPGHPATRRALAAIDALAAPCPDPDLGPIFRALRGRKFAAIRGDHVVLLHQGGEAEARERIGVLERVVRTFAIALAAQGLELAPPGRRIVSVWFARQADYVAFLRQAEAGAFATTQGYYHPTLRAVFAFDTRDGQAQVAGRRAIANLRRDGAGGPDLDRRTLLLDLEWRATDLGIAAHETVHQLVDASGLAPRFDDFPLWLHEGLAAQFEVVRGGRWAGLGKAHDLRLPDWRSIRPAPRLAPLLRDADLARGYRRDAYAESWALVYFLRKSRPREFLAFLDLLRSPTPDEENPGARSTAAFRAAFGDDLPALEAEWRAFVDKVRTPLDADRPTDVGPRKVPLPGPGPALKMGDPEFPSAP